MKQTIAQLSNKLDQAFPTGPLAMAVFRIGFALMILCEIIQLCYFRAYLFAGTNMASAALPVLLLYGFCAGMLLLGWQTSLAAIGTYACTVVLLGFGGLGWEDFEYHADTFYLAGSLFLLFAPSARALAVDRAAHRRTAPRAPVS